jgi:hypothetical protein
LLLVVLGHRSRIPFL